MTGTSFRPTMPSMSQSVQTTRDKTSWGKPVLRCIDGLQRADSAESSRQEPVPSLGNRSLIIKRIIRKDEFRFSGGSALRGACVVTREESDGLPGKRTFTGVGTLCKFANTLPRDWRRSGRKHRTSLPRRVCRPHQTRVDPSLPSRIGEDERHLFYDGPAVRMSSRRCGQCPSVIRCLWHFRYVKQLRGCPGVTLQLPRILSHAPERAERNTASITRIFACASSSGIACGVPLNIASANVAAAMPY